MFALEIIKALNDPNNPAKPKGSSARLRNVSAVDGETEPAHIRRCSCGEHFRTKETNEQASAALDRREERNISHYSGRFRY